MIYIVHYAQMAAVTQARFPLQVFISHVLRSIMFIRLRFIYLLKKSRRLTST